MNINNSMPSVLVDAPYPEVAVAEKNPAYARMMLDNYGGSNSEMSALSSYLFSNLSLLPQYPDIADVFMEIGEVEMGHLHIFGRLSSMLGAEPRLWTPCTDGYKYWTPCYNVYPTNLSDIIDIAIRGENRAIEKYQNQIAQISDTNIKAVLERIIMDEERHIEIFEWIRDKYVLGVGD